LSRVDHTLGKSFPFAYQLGALAREIARSLLRHFRPPIRLLKNLDQCPLPFPRSWPTLARNEFRICHMNKRIIYQAVLISLTCPPHCNNALGECFMRHDGVLVSSKSAARSPPNTPHGIECRSQCLGCFGIERWDVRSGSIGIAALTSACFVSPTCDGWIICAIRCAGDYFVRWLLLE